MASMVAGGRNCLIGTWVCRIEDATCVCTYVIDSEECAADSVASHLLLTFIAHKNRHIASCGLPVSLCTKRSD